MVKLRNFGVALVFILPHLACAQEISKLSLQQAHDLAQKNYPAIRQKELVKKAAQLSIDNLSRGMWPQIQVNGQATYQSDVTKISGSIIPGFNIQSPDKDQYKIVADVSQVLYEGGTIREEKLSRQLNEAVDEQRIEVELYSIRERVNQLYFGILYLDEQIKQVALVEADIATGIKTVEAQVNNGVSLRSKLNLLKAELLTAGQRRIELSASRRGFVDALALFVGQPLSQHVTLEAPSSLPNPSDSIQRPELKLFENQNRLYGAQTRLIQSRLLPRASLFAQTGFGKPGLNLLDNQFKFYYIGGLRLNWSLSSLYTQKKEKELARISQQTVGVQKETFLLNTNIQLKQQKSEVDKLQQLVDTDNAIIDLRRSVTDAAKAQLENGVITANDYLKQLNAEDQARQSQITHRIQLLQAQVNYQTILGQ